MRADRWGIGQIHYSAEPESIQLASTKYFTQFTERFRLSSLVLFSESAQRRMEL